MNEMLVFSLFAIIYVSPVLAFILGVFTLSTRKGVLQMGLPAAIAAFGVLLLLASDAARAPKGYDLSGPGFGVIGVLLGVASATLSIIAAFLGRWFRQKTYPRRNREP